MTHCIFNGADVDDWSLVDLGHQRPSGNVLQIRNCDFRECRTKRKALLNEYIKYTGLFNTSRSVHGVCKINCTGEKNTDGRGSVDMNQNKKKEKGLYGRKIGISNTEEMLSKVGALI